MESFVPSSVPPPKGRLAVGDTIGADLTVTGTLGQGGTGVVYACHHALLGREVAVKMSHVYGASAADSRARLVREAKMCASVRNAHLPRIYALDALEDGTPYIVMEKVSGTALSHILEQGRLPPRTACDIALKLLAALTAVHGKGIVHRDVKPGNLMVELSDEGPRVRLLDFGVGKVLRPDNPDQASLTCQGELLGTPLYMSPEQVLGQPVDERADLYATGVVLYEMLAGRTPFEANSLGEVFAAVLRDEITPLSTHRPDLPAELLALVHRATAKKAEERFGSAREMRTALELAMADLPFEPERERASLVPPPAGVISIEPEEVQQTWVFRPEAHTLTEGALVKRHRRISLLSLANTMRAHAHRQMPAVKRPRRSRVEQMLEG